MQNILVLIAIISGVLMFIGLLSEFINETPLLSEPLIALGAGIICGPAVLNLMDPFEWIHYERTLELITLITLAMGLMGVALRIPSAALQARRGSIAMLLGVVMPLMWLVSSGLVALILGLPLLTALLIGAIVTPTDPIVASSIVTGHVAKKNLPDRLRHLLSAESGFNDGLAFPVVFLAIFLLGSAEGRSFGDWFLDIVLWQTVGGGIIGAVIGYVGGKLLGFAEREESIEHAAFLTFTITLALFTLGLVEVVGANGVFAVFVSGVAFSVVADASDRTEEAGIQEAISLLFTLPVFIFIGMVIPWQGWFALGWPALLLVIAILLLRRLPALLLLQRGIGALTNRYDVLFVGWFGPIGVAALFYALVSLHHGAAEVVWHVAMLVIVASIIAHGASATTFTRMYAENTSKASESPPDGDE